MNNTIQRKPKFSVALTTEAYQNLISNTIQDPARRMKFIGAISSAVAVNPALQECEAGSILTGALLGEALNLSPSPQLGHYYLIPFEVGVKDGAGKQLYEKDEKGQIIKDEKGKWKKVTVKKSNFVLGYKGYLQLAMRSGQYKKLNVMPIKAGELISYDPLDEEIRVNLIQDEFKRENTETIGYYAMFEYTNGFKKAMYWTKEKMQAHADRYSKAYNLNDDLKLKSGQIPEADQWKYSSFWYKSFDDMAAKTMLRQLISHWGIMSIEIESSFTNNEGIKEMINNMPDLLPDDPQSLKLPESEAAQLEESDADNGNLIQKDSSETEELTLDDL